MRQPSRRKAFARRARVEMFEHRWMMSGQPLADQWLDHDLDQPGPLEIWEVTTALADAHLISGVHDARETYGLTGAGQTVAIVDSGIAYDHYALGGGLGEGFRVVGGWDFSEENDADPYDDAPAGFHGTHVAGIIASSDSVRTGVAPQVDLVALRVFNDVGQGQFAWIERALRWVHDHRRDFRYPITTVNLSLGADWNGNTVPNWGVLEDELAQLKSDGIFIAASAGNSFAAYRKAGLGYPAASPHVVPVASIGNDGKLSPYSQRHDRVIAAPGQHITSTVPDYLFDFDGVSDDFATASGTSMAAPYLAGASVLLREAYTFSGRDHVTQEELYQLMRDTADPVWDALTSQYYLRLNLAAALASLMPADDFGSTSAQAYRWGTIVADEARSLVGIIGQLADADYFTFTAGASGTATLALTSDAAARPRWTMTGELSSTVTEQGDGASVLSFPVAAGQGYTVGVAADGQLARYQINASLESVASDLGLIDSRLLRYQTFVGGDTWYSFQPARDGLVTVEALFDHAGGNVDLELYHGAGHLVATSAAATDNERLDATVVAGDMLRLKVAGANPQVDLRITNLLSQSGSSVKVHGTDADDTFVFTAGATHFISINGVDYFFDGNSVDTFSFEGGLGNDSVALTGMAGDQAATLRPQSAQLSGGQYTAGVQDAEEIRIDSRGDNVVARLYDSPASDSFVFRPQYTWAKGDGYYNYVSGFDTVYAYATRGGVQDRALFYDSSADDRFIAKPSSARMDGNGYFNYASGFDKVYAYATAGGSDRAYLYDSAGSDVLVARPEHTRLSGEDYLSFVQNFDRVYAYANAGGTDRAYLYDSAGNDVLFGRPEHTRLGGEDFLSYAQNFDRVYAYAGAGGFDRAYLYDSDGDDNFVGRPEYGLLSGDSFSNYAQGFDRVYSYAVGRGYDRAYMMGSAGDNIDTTSSDYRRMSGSDYFRYAEGFESFYADDTTGKCDRDSMVGSAANDPMAAPLDIGRLSEGPYALYRTNDRRLHGVAIGGGARHTHLLGSAGYDLSNLRAKWRLGTLSGDRSTVVTERIGDIEAVVGNGQALVGGAPSGDSALGRQDFARHVNASVTRPAHDWNAVLARSLAGQWSHPDLIAVDHLFQRVGEWG
jgi:subtilisin family serine protease